MTYYQVRYPGICTVPSYDYFSKSCAKGFLLRKVSEWRSMLRPLSFTIFLKLYLRNIKHFPCWYTVISTQLFLCWYTVISTWVEIGKARNYLETQRPQGGSVFTQFRIFPIFTSNFRIDITVYQYGKNVLYFFYNIAQITLTEEWREIFRVDIELYQHGS